MWGIMSNSNSYETNDRDVWLVDWNEMRSKRRARPDQEAMKSKIDFDPNDAQYLDMVERSDVDAQSDIWEVKVQGDLAE